MANHGTLITGKMTEETRFLFICKSLYINGIHPFDLDKVNTAPYQEIMLKGQVIMKRAGIQEFLGFLMESQYRVNLWAAMIALWHGNPGKDEILSTSKTDTIIDHCLNTVAIHLNFQTTEKQQRNGQNWIQEMTSRYTDE